jgi:outer membrane protein
MGCQSGLTDRPIRRLAWIGVLLGAVAAQPSQAQSLSEALSQAYINNPQLNSARAQLRVTNENVPQALSGYRPRVSVNASAGQQWSEARAFGNTTSAVRTPRSVGIQVDQTLFNGFQTDNQVRQAEAQVRSQREVLRTTEQDVLLAAATVYMDVVRDSALVELQRNFVNVINEQLRATRSRFEVGEVTRTDVAQAESRLALSRSQLAAAQAQLNLSRANYLRVVGRPAQQRLNGRTTVEGILPRSIEQALSVGSNEHPQIRAAVFGVDSAAFAVAVAQAALYPTVTVTGLLQRQYAPSTTVDRLDTASIVGRVTIPIYDGGIGSSRVRQAKESLGQSRINIDVVRDQVRALIISNWGNLDAQRAQIEAARAQIAASEIALNGVREEARVGQRTTLDVLNAQQDLLNARVSLVQAERNRVVAAYALLGAIGRLNLPRLGLNVPQHDPTLHYNQVRDRWHGMRTPSGE